MVDDIKFYLSLFWRRFPYVLVILVLAGGIGVGVAANMPQSFRASAMLIAEAPEIPEDMAASTVRAGGEQQVATIYQRLTTRSRLVDLAEELEIYDDSAAIGMEPEEIVADLRDRIAFNTNTSGDAVLIEVSFTSDDADQAARVANQLAERVEQEGERMRRGAAGGTLDFFEAEIERLREDMAQQSARILDFRLANINALPGDLDYRRERRDNLEERVAELTRDIRDMRDERDRLVQAFERTGELPGATGQLSPDEQELRDAREDLRAALRVYSDQHPRVRQIQARVHDLQRITGSDAQADPGAIFEEMIDEHEAEIADLQEQRATLEAEIIRLGESIDATPENEVRLAELEREFDNIRNQYGDTQNRLSQAEMGARIETSARGHRISIIEPAIVPTAAEGPGRRVVAMGSVGGGLAAGVGLVVLLELLNSAVRRPVEITSRLGITPIATLPYIPTRQQILLRRFAIGSAVLALLTAMIVLWVVHVYYTPLDVLLLQGLEWLGIVEGAEAAQ